MSQSDIKQREKDFHNFIKDFRGDVGIRATCLKYSSVEWEFDEKTYSLLKLAIAVAHGNPGAIESGVRNCIESGVSSNQIKQIPFLSIDTLGVPSASSAYTLIKGVLECK